MPSKDTEHNFFCTFDVAEALTDLIDSLPPTTGVAQQREAALAEFQAFLDWFLADA
jgi:hypothetical protein